MQAPTRQQQRERSPSGGGGEVSEEEDGGRRKPRFGLVHGRKADNGGGGGGRKELGPDPALLAARERERQEEERQKAQARRKQPCVLVLSYSCAVHCPACRLIQTNSLVFPHNTTNAHRLTEEERQRRLAAMQQDGVLNEEKRRERVQRSVEREKAEDARDAGMTVETKRGLDKEARPQFLQKIGAEAYMGGGETLEERMQKLQHTRQRQPDERGFL